MMPDIAKKGHSFSGAFDYYLHDKGKDTAERVGWTETLNLMTDDPQAAKRIMIATALQADELKKAAGLKTGGRKSNQHVYAYALSWHPDEAGTLDKAEMMLAVHASLKELKADHLQAVVVCHTDQKHPHVHVVLNRVDPADGRLHTFSNDRLKLQDWAERYDNERGNSFAPVRAEKRQQREAHQDKKSRQDYARRKRDEASARPKDELSPAAMLKDLSASQKERHRQEWKDLSADNKAKRNQIYADFRQRIKDAVALHKLESKPFWRDHFKNERDRKKAFNERETNVIGRVQNAMSATAYQHMKGELDGRGKLSATFTNLLSSQKRRTLFEKRLDMDKQTLRQELKLILDAEVASIQTQRKEVLKDQRASFDQSRSELIERQDGEWAKVREAWKQLRGRSYRRYQRSEDPVKKDWNKTAPPDLSKPKPHPTRKATVSTPSPAPSPAGEVPRATAQAKEVPAKDWAKMSETGRIEKSRPAKKDWEKTGASAAKIDQSKDWSKKAERSPVKKAPTPRHDLDRSR